MFGKVKGTLINDSEEDNESEEPFLVGSRSNINGNGSISYQKLKQISTTTSYGVTESHQYEADESEVYRQHQLQRHLEDKEQFWSFSKRREVKRWLLTFIIGCLCGIVAIFVTYFTKTLSSFKFKIFHLIIAKEKMNMLPYGSAFLVLCLFNILFASIAWFTVFLEPLAAGSGIPEIKCFLNGLNIPRIVRFKTLACKIVGLIFSNSSGLPLGKEGPMVHAGAVIAAGVSQGKSNTLGFDTAFSKFQDFRNDKEKRDFVACGAAAGVAAAFGAPVGGVLFSLEEGASFWSTKLTWRCFFCAMTTVFTVIAINSASSFFGHSDSNAMFSFGEFFSLQGEKSNYSVWELLLFLIIGCMGGLIGALFNMCHSSLHKFRSEAMLTRYQRLIEVLLVVFLMSSFSFFLPLLWGKCTPLPVKSSGLSDQEKTLMQLLEPLYCDGRTHYNELASLYLTDSDTAIKQLFHFREVGDHNDSTFSSSALFMFFIPYIFMACVVCGTSVPAGMFVPSLLSGAAFGRLVGHLLHRIDNARGTFADGGTYALLGAAAITGGISRLTISLTVMILEATGDMQYVLPLMLTLMASRLVGNMFSEGLYDVNILNSNLDYLDEDERVSKVDSLQDLVVSEIMSTSPICLSPMVRVGEVMDLLEVVSHHCFPIVDEHHGGVFVGTVLRKVLCSLIKHRAFCPPVTANTTETARRSAPVISWSTLESIYPRYPDLHSLVVSAVDRLAWLDLRPYIDRAAYTINEHATVQRAYRMFRTLGLRHLCVADHHGKVLGIVTRADLIPSHIQKKANRQKKKKTLHEVHSFDVDIYTKHF